MNILDTLTAEQKELVRYRRLQKNEVLCRENDICGYVGIVVKGKLSIVSYLSDGKEVIYNEPGEDDMFGNNLIFSSSPYYKGDVTASVESEIAIIYKDDLTYLLQNNKDFLVSYMAIQSDFAKDLNDRIKLLAIDSAEERLLFLLHKNDNLIRYDSITSLARSLFIERETLSRLLSRMEKDNRIVRVDSTIRLR